MVQSESGKTVVSTDGSTHKREKVLMVLHNTVISSTTEKNVIKVATKKHKDKFYFKQEGIDEANVLESKKKEINNLKKLNRIKDQITVLMYHNPI